MCAAKVSSFAVSECWEPICLATLLSESTLITIALAQEITRGEPISVATLLSDAPLTTIAFAQEKS